MKQYFLTIIHIIAYLSISGCVLQIDQTRDIEPIPSQDAVVDAKYHLPIRALADGMAIVQYDLILDTKADQKDPQKMQQFFEFVVLPGAHALDVQLNTQELIGISTISDGEDLVGYIESELSSLHGNATVILFRLQYYRNLGQSLLFTAQQLDDQPESTKNGIDWAQQYWGKFIEAAEQAGIEPEVIDTGKNLLEKVQYKNIGSIELLDAALGKWSDMIVNILEGNPTPAPSSGLPTSTPIVVDKIGEDIFVPLPSGDSSRGEEFTMTMGCIGCHSSDWIAPAWNVTDSGEGESMIEQANKHWEADTYTGNARTIEQYLLEAMIQPNANTVLGYQAGISPSYSEIITEQDAADIIAYLLTLE